MKIIWEKKSVWTSVSASQFELKILFCFEFFFCYLHWTAAAKNVKRFALAIFFYFFEKEISFLFWCWKNW